MAIDETTEITLVRVYYHGDARFQIAHGVQAFNGSTLVSNIYPPRNNEWDLNDADFLELDRRIEEGTVTLEYQWGRFTNRWSEDQIPSLYRARLIEQNPFYWVQSIPSQETQNQGPHTEFYFQRLASGITPTLPDFSTFDGDSVTVASLMTGASWSRTVPSGDGLVWHTRVTWSIVEGVASAQGSTPTTDDLRYSTDNGDTFTTSPPSNLDDLDLVQQYIAGTGWIEFPVGDEEVVSPIVYLAGVNWQNAQNGADNAQQFIAMPSDSAILKDNYRIGFDVAKTQSWTATDNYDWRGTVSIPTAAIVLCTPEEYAGRNSSNYTRFKTYMLVQNKEHGSIEFGISQNGIALTAYDQNYYGSMFINFLSYPKVSLPANLAAATTVFDLGNVEQLAVGDTLFINDEQLAVTAINSTNVGVTRGANGTTAADHSSGDTVRAIVNRDEVRYVAIVSRYGVPDNTKVQIFRVRKRGAN